MFKHIALAACSVLFAANLMAAQPAAKPTHVVLDTSFGKIELELEDQKAPISTKNFLSYVDSGFYTNTIFHRVIPGFMVQGGGFTAQMLQKQTKDPIKNEAANGLHNVRGTIAMARTSDVNSATSQFFITPTTTPCSITVCVTSVMPCSARWSTVWMSSPRSLTHKPQPKAACKTCQSTRS